jgi:hypothetical protein
MRSSLIRARGARFFALALLAAAAIAADDGFAKFWPQFQAVVAKNDAKSIIQGVQFPLEWELGKVRKIDSNADFLSHFSAYFTADMRRAVATQKPVSIPDAKYMITWHARGNEYSMYFKSQGGTWALVGLSEGPP